MFPPPMNPMLWSLNIIIPPRCSVMIGLLSPSWTAGSSPARHSPLIADAHPVRKGKEFLVAGLADFFSVVLRHGVIIILKKPAILYFCIQLAYWIESPHKQTKGKLWIYFPK
jgi:hypothetical protein